MAGSIKPGYAAAAAAAAAAGDAAAAAAAAADVDLAAKDEWPAGDIRARYGLEAARDGCVMVEDTEAAEYEAGNDIGRLPDVTVEEGGKRPLSPRRWLVGSFLSSLTTGLTGMAGFPLSL